jgi:hypothetical protein
LEVVFDLKNEVVDVVHALLQRCPFERVEFVAVEAFAGKGLQGGDQLQELAVEGKDFRGKCFWPFEVVLQRQFPEVFRGGETSLPGADLDVPFFRSGGPATDLAGLFVVGRGVYGLNFSGFRLWREKMRKKVAGLFYFTKKNRIYSALNLTLKDLYTNLIRHLN